MENKKKKFMIVIGTFISAEGENTENILTQRLSDSES